MESPEAATVSLAALEEQEVESGTTLPRQLDESLAEATEELGAQAVTLNTVVDSLIKHVLGIRPAPA